MRFASRTAVITAAATLLALPAGPALATAAPASGFGQHVSGCAQDMGGFAGDHNPGMHQGASGWDGQPCQ
jgi:hypothetical protein